jgi:hypothetical protein
MHIVKFFTSPPEPYPYILINVIFDSMAWTRPIDSTLNANYSCKNKEQRIKFFERWLEKYNSIINKNTLDNFL